MEPLEMNRSSCPRCGAILSSGGGGICPACTMGNLFGFEEEPEQKIEFTSEEVLDGKYQLGKILGEGGFGVVYQATQTRPVQREVAIKMLKPGSESQRFEAEGQALASLDHPGIAKVFDAGVDEGGVPYLVMEYFRGKSVTEVRGTLEEKLAFFIQICEAVQHAHQRGIIHRDLKPSNILVNESGDFKVIDFGIAKATQQLLTEKTLLTGMHQFVGTPGYVSPEQAGMKGRDVDTRSDIYSLGALLHELLMGEAPFGKRLAEADRLAETLRIIQEEEPPRPSGLPPDLGWIILRALAKNPDERYSSASELARDIQRYLAHEPTEAHGPGRIYRLKKFIHRNKAASLAIASLVVGLFLATYGLLRAQQEAQTATVQAERASAVVDLINGLFSASDPALLHGSDYTVRQLLDDYSEEFIGRLDGQPEVELSLQETLAGAYQGLGEHELAEGHFQRAQDLARQLNLSEVSEKFELALAGSYRKQGRYRAAKGKLENLEESPRRDVLLVDVLRLLKEGDSSLKLARALVGRVEGQEELSILALSFSDAGEFETARKLAQKSLQSAESQFGPISPRLIAPCQALADIEEAAGDHEAQIAQRERALQLAEQFLSEDHPLRIYAATRLAGMKGSHSGENVSKLVSRLVGRVGKNPEMLKPLMTLGAQLFREGKNEQAVDLISRLLKIDYQGLTSGETLSVKMGGSLIADIVDSGRIGDFLPLVHAAHDEAESLFGNDGTHTIQLKSVLGYMYRWERRYEEALSLARQTFQLNRKRYGESHGTTLNSLIHYTDTLWDLGREMEAFAIMVGDLEGTRSESETALVAEKLAKYHGDRGRGRLAIKLLHRALELSLESENRLRLRHALVAWEYQGNWFRKGEGADFLRESYRSAREVLGRHHPMTVDLAFWLASDRGQFLGLPNAVNFLEKELAHAEQEKIPRELIKRYAEKLNLRRADLQRQEVGLRSSLESLRNEKDPKKQEKLRAKAMDQSFYLLRTRQAESLHQNALQPDSSAMRLSLAQGYWRVGKMGKSRKIIEHLFNETIFDDDTSLHFRSRMSRVLYRHYWDSNESGKFWKTFDQCTDEKFSVTDKSEVLIPRGSRWFYHWSKNPPRSDWSENEHRYEMRWRRGRGLFSDYRFVEQCRLPYRRNGRVPAAQFRRNFLVEDVGRYSRLRLRLTYPAGVIVYLNGREIVRRDLPKIVSSATYGKRVTSNFPLSADFIEVPVDALHSGENTLAVQVHRRNDRSALFFEVQLEGVLK